MNNIRDSSVSNTSTHGNSSLAAYTSVAGVGKKNQQKLGMMNNFMPSNLPQSFYNASGNAS